MIQCPNCKVYNIDSAYFCKECGKQLQDIPDTNVHTSNQSQSRNETALVLTLLLVIVLIIAIPSYRKTKNELKSKIDEMESVKKELNWLKINLDAMVDEDLPLVISKIEVRNKGEEYNHKISSSNTTFINGKIYYFSTKSHTITLYVKFYKNNILSHVSGDMYHDDYSFSFSISTSAYCFSEYECDALGREKAGYWTAGDYRYEIWYEDKCLGVKHFTIY